MNLDHIENYTEEEYLMLKNSGMMWEFFPEATGDYEKDVLIPRKESAEKMISHAKEIHKVWHKFDKWLVNTFGKDLYGDWVRNKIKVDGKRRIFKYRPFNDLEFSRRLCGYDVIERIERYVKRHCPEIKIVYCDDDVYSGSIILLIPHPTHGISVMFIPQCTSVQNRFFLYGNHYKMLMEELEKMKTVYTDDDDL